jgi:hypothetical protein
METLTLKNESRGTHRPRRIHRRMGRRLLGFIPDADHHRVEKESKLRFRICSIAPAIEQDPPERPMRVLLRHAKTMKFLGPGGRWTEDARKARDFRNGWWATFYAFTINPRHLVIHYEFDDDRYNLHIPVLGHAQI